jgi:hypothetical protein
MTARSARPAEGCLAAFYFLEVSMTAKQAIKARCRDCLAGNRICTFTDCSLKELSRAKRGSDRTAAIRKNCQWCMNGNPVNQCASPDCAIYQFRAGTDTGLNVRFWPVDTRSIETAALPIQKA